MTLGSSWLHPLFGHSTSRCSASEAKLQRVQMPRHVWAQSMRDTQCFLARLTANAPAVGPTCTSVSAGGRSLGTLSRPTALVNRDTEYLQPDHSAPAIVFFNHGRGSSYHYVFRAWGKVADLTHITIGSKSPDSMMQVLTGHEPYYFKLAYMSIHTKFSRSSLWSLSDKGCVTIRK